MRRSGDALNYPRSVESEPSLYNAEIDLDNDNDSHVLMIRMVGGGKRVLDVGCWNGDMASHFAPRNVEVVGIEKDESAARLAAGRMHRVVVGDVEDLDLTGELGEATFDVVVLGDVLEHLVNPGQTLRRIRPLLAPGGYIVASIPNVAHGSVRLNLLRGDFRYTDVGLLDRTHLRFFTRDTVEELFEQAGFLIVETKTTTVDPLQAPEGPIEPSSADADVVERLQADPDAHVYQFVLRAIPDDSNHAIMELYRRERQLSAEVATLRRTAAGRAQARARGLVQVAVVGADHTAQSWCLSLLQREIERRWPELAVVVLPAADRSPIHLRWADAVVLLGCDEVPPELSQDVVIPVDLSSARLAGMAGGSISDSPLFGLALHAARARKDDGGPQRLAMLRLLGAVPAEDYLVVAVEPGAIGDLEGFSEVLRRTTGTGRRIVLVPLSDESELQSIGDAVRSAGMTPTTLTPSAPLEDVITVLDRADGVITTDSCVAAMAISLGLPHVFLTSEGAPATLMAAIGGGVATAVEAVQGTLYRTSDLASQVAKLAPVQARVDDVLDAAVGILTAVPILEERTTDPEYVRSLEHTVGSLQRRIFGERVKLASAFEKVESDSFVETMRQEARWSEIDARYRALRGAADSYRTAMADLQERLHEATRCRQSPAPEPAGRGLGRIVRGVVRRLHVMRP